MSCIGGTVECFELNFYTIAEAKQGSNTLSVT